MKFAPEAFRNERVKATAGVEDMLKVTFDFSCVTGDLINKHPTMLPALRMACCPPVTRDRLTGLAYVSKSLVDKLDSEGKFPARMPAEELVKQLNQIGTTIIKLADKDILIWLNSTNDPTEEERHRAASIIADRLCGENADAIIRNSQEARQLALLKGWLEARGYKHVPSSSLKTLEPGQFAFRMNVPVKQGKAGVNIPVDVAVKRLKASAEEMPLLIEAKSAGDFTNVNKRRKEEATKMSQLKATYGYSVIYVLFLCGYFDSGYLGYEASEGIDWVWEHRISDFERLSL